MRNCEKLLLQINLIKLIESLIKNWFFYQIYIFNEFIESTVISQWIDKQPLRVGCLVGSRSQFLVSFTRVTKMSTRKLVCSNENPLSNLVIFLERWRSFKQSIVILCFFLDETPLDIKHQTYSRFVCIQTLIVRVLLLLWCGFIHFYTQNVWNLCHAHIELNFKGDILIKGDTWIQSLSQFSVYLQANQTFNEIFQTMREICNRKKTKTAWSPQK